MKRSRRNPGVLRLAAFFALLLASLPAAAGGIGVVGTVLSDNGDNDLYADTQETVTLRLIIRNTSGQNLSGVTARLATTDGAIACLTRPVISIGELLIDEELTTDEGFEFVITPGVQRTSIEDSLSVRFGLFFRSSELELLGSTPWIELDLDLNVSGGSGPTTFFESFEDGFGAFTTMHLDESLNPPDSDLGNREAGVINADGWRCQHSDPAWQGSSSFGNAQGEQCFPNPNGAPDAFYFGIATDRSFTGAQSLRWNVFLDEARGYTIPTAQVEAVRTIDPVNLGWDRVCSVTRSLPCGDLADCPPGEECEPASPRLTMRHQISLLDHRTVTGGEGRAAERNVVAAQKADDAGDPISSWIKIYPFVNHYDSQANTNYFSCKFEPADDGNDEGDFFDPTDPQRQFGPSSTCFPEFIFAHQGDTDAPFDPLELGDAGGPGLGGEFGIGTWVAPVFNLERFRGQRLRLRLLTAGFNSGGAVTWEQAFSFNPDPGEDGWFVDDVTVTDALNIPATVVPDEQDNSFLPFDIGDDLDMDGIYSVCDNCPEANNAGQYDRDDDGIGNACDACPDDPLNDIDGDGHCRGDDNCPEVANTDQSDHDGDFRGDRCDTCPLVYNPTQSVDEDEDGLDCFTDNCPTIANVDQADADGDGIGDACDTCPDDATPDADGDGVCGSQDSCLFYANPSQGLAVALGTRLNSGSSLLLTADESTLVGELRLLGSLPSAGGELTVLSTRAIDQHDITPDGSTVIFREYRIPRYVLYSVPIDGGNPTRLGLDVSDGAVPWFEISPDGSRVVYTMEVGDPGSEVLELLSVSPQGGPSTILSPLSASGEDFLGVRISSDSSSVLLWRDGPELYTVPIDGGPATNLAPPSGSLAVIADAQFSPDGNRVIFRASTETNPADELYSVPADGSLAPVKINAPLVVDGSVGQFKIGPGGSQIFYTADQEVDGYDELYQVPILGGPVTKLNAPLPGGRDVTAFEISPDGSRVAYLIGLSWQDQSLFTVPAGGGAALETGPATFFAFTPDGSRLVYRTVYPDYFLWSVDPGGGEPVQLTGDPVGASFYISDDGPGVTYRTGTPPRLFRVPIDGGNIIELSDGIEVGTAFPGSVLAQTHDGSITYWRDPSNWLHASWLDPDPDGDGTHRACDCDEDYAGGNEINDGLDNQCPGGDGFGLVDELPGPAGFTDPQDPNRYAWTPQAGAIEYEVIRAGDPEFTVDCSCTSVFDTSVTITEQPPEGVTYFYLPRAAAPNPGSAGADSAGIERTGACLLAACQ